MLHQLAALVTSALLLTSTATATATTPDSSVVRTDLGQVRGLVDDTTRTTRDWAADPATSAWRTSRRHCAGCGTTPRPSAGTPATSRSWASRPALTASATTSSPTAAGLFQRAIVQSGPCTQQYSVTSRDEEHGRIGAGESATGSPVSQAEYEAEVRARSGANAGKILARYADVPLPDTRWRQ